MKKSKLHTITWSKLEGTAIETIQNIAKETGRKIVSKPDAARVHDGDSANKPSQTGRSNDISTPPNLTAITKPHI